MATPAGALEIIMFSGITRLQADMNAHTKTVGRAMSSIQSSISMATRAFAALGVGLGVSYFGRFLKGIVDTQDELSKLSQKLDITVEQLAGLRHAADLAGVSGEALTKGFKTLSSQMFDASMGLLESKRNFGLLGIEVKNTDGTLRGTQAVMLQVADKFASMQDGAAKSALAVKLFGKAGLDMVPLLNEGSAAIAGMIAEGQRLNPVTAESAKQAEIFNDNMTRVGGTMKGAFIEAMNKAMPWISDISVAMAQAAKDAGFWAAALVGLGGAISKIFQMPELQKANKEFSELTDRLLDLQNARDRAAAGGFPSMLSTLDAQIANTKRRLAEVQKILDSMKTPDKPGTKPPKSVLEIPDDEAMKKAQKERERYRKMDADGWVKYIDAVNAEYEDGLREQAKLDEEFWKKKDELRVADQAAMFAMIDAEQDAAIEAGAIMAQGITENHQRLQEEADEFKRLFGTIESTGKNVWTLLTAGGENMADAVGKAIKASIWDLLYQLTVRKWVISIGTSIAGSLGMPGAAGASGGGIGDMLGMASDANSAVSLYGKAAKFLGFGPSAASTASWLSTAGGLGAGSALAMGGGGLGLSAAGGGLGLSAAGGGIGLSTAGVNAAAIGTGAAAGAGAMGTLVAVAPYVAAAVAIGGALGLFGGSGGGPASFTGIDVKAILSRSGFAGQLFGTSKNSEDSFSWPTFMPGGLQEAANAAVTTAFTEVAKLGNVLGLDTSVLAGVSSNVSFHSAAHDTATITQDLINSMGALTDEMALKLLPNIKEFQQAGETLTQTLTRLANETYALAQANKTTAEAALLDAYKREVDLQAQRVTAANAAADALRGAYQAQASALTATVKQWQDAATALRQYSAMLTGSTGTVPGNYAFSSGQFSSTAARARLGDMSAIGQLQSVSETFRAASEANSSTREDYLRDIAKIQSALSDTAAVADRQESVAQQQLDAMTAQVSALININAGVLTLQQTIDAYISARDAADTGQIQLAAMTTQVSALITINQSVLSVADAVKNLQAITAAIAKMDAAQVAAAIPAAAVAAAAAVSQSSSQDSLLAQIQDLQDLMSNIGDGSGTPAMRRRLADLRAQLDIPGHASGLSYVPTDNYLMRAHQGEAVLNRSQANEWRGGAANDDLVAEIRSLRAEVSAMRKDTRKSADTLEAVSRGQLSFSTEAAA